VQQRLYPLPIPYWPFLALKGLVMRRLAIMMGVPLQERPVLTLLLAQGGAWCPGFFRRSCDGIHDLHRSLYSVNSASSQDVSATRSLRLDPIIV